MRVSEDKVDHEIDKATLEALDEVKVPGWLSKEFFQEFCVLNVVPL